MSESPDYAFILPSANSPPCPLNHHPLNNSLRAARDYEKTLDTCPCVFYVREIADLSTSYRSLASMAIFPNLTGQPIGPHQPAQPINIEAWTEQATQSLNTISLSSPAGVRGTSVSLAIPLDEQAAAKRSAGAVEGQHGPDTSEALRSRREPLRRDSLKRREALLKGKEGSRRRQRWENGSYG